MRFSERVLNYTKPQRQEKNHTTLNPTSRTIMHYGDHPKSKFDGEIGILGRKYVFANGITYIGKKLTIFRTSL